MFEEVNACIDKKEAPGGLDRAIELLEGLRAAHPRDDVVLGKLAHAFFYKGFFAAEGSRERAAFFERGVSHGLAAIRLSPGSVYGHFWYGSNLGMLGLCKGIMASLKSIEPMRRSMEIVRQQDERFFFAGPHRALGQLYRAAPGWPISIGNKTRALDHLERAVELAPTFFNNRLLLAEMYLELGRKDRARGELRYLLDTPLHPDHAVEDGAYQREARRLHDRVYG